MHAWETVWAQVKASEDLEGWTVRPKPGKEGYCWHDSKVLDVGVDSEDPAALLLHEVAHALNPGLVPPHDVLWFLTFVRLLCQYLDFTPPSRSEMLAVGHHAGWAP